MVQASILHNSSLQQLKRSYSIFTKATLQRFNSGLNPDTKFKIDSSPRQKPIHGHFHDFP